MCKGLMSLKERTVPPNFSVVFWSIFRRVHHILSVSIISPQCPSFQSDYLSSLLENGPHPTSPTSLSSVSHAARSNLWPGNGDDLPPFPSTNQM
jgi:hypothetical protein